tara:strand:- start:227 stop:985 length:759 start_codon:yes stop_codon:yes gene_type:complete
MTKNRIQRSDIGDFSSKEIEEILFPDISLKRSCVALVFGRGLMTGFLAQQAAELYKQGLVKRIIVSGGVAVEKSKDTPGYITLGIEGQLQKEKISKPRLNMTEAEWARKILIAQGIPKTKIEFENNSRHTGENVTKCIEHHDLLKAKDIIIVGEFCHCRRLVETVRHYIPKEKNIAIAIKPVFMPGLNRQNWVHQSRLINGFIMPELQRLGFLKWDQPDYIQQGFITPTSWKSEIKKYRKSKANKNRNIRKL